MKHFPSINSGIIPLSFTQTTVDQPFIVYTLPRSRSAWLSYFLAYGGALCGHDVAPTCHAVADFVQAIGTRFTGTVETGAVIGWRAIKHFLPNARVAVVRRPVDQIYESFAQLGIEGEELLLELQNRARMLDEVSKQPGVKSFSFDELNSEVVCKELFEFCTDQPFDSLWWSSCARRNIQIDVAKQLRYLDTNRARIDKLKAEMEQYNQPKVVVGLEPWDSIWPEVNEIAAKHFVEVDGKVDLNRPYQIDETLMEAMDKAGCLKIITARVDDVLAGYCTWNISPDVESKGLLIAQQGAWFVQPEFSCLGLGMKLFDTSIELLKDFGVKNVFPHHRLNGRGAKLGNFFKRRGAVEIQHTYSLWIGD